jgi:2-polyprenyl-3-methyl-5-hydroxy-6-metoxy-1,4-benzoquinol methylase
MPADRTSWMLDLGCGRGEFLLYLQSIGFENIEGIDISPEQVMRAKENGLPNVYESDAITYLNSAQRRYDVIAVLNILEHLAKSELFELLDVIKDRLTDNGLLIGVIPNAKSLFGARVRYADLSHEQSFTPKSLEQMLNIIGMKIVTVREHGPMIHNISSLMRWIIWQLIRLIVWIMLMAEGGEIGNRVYTQDMMFVAKKCE